MLKKRTLIGAALALSLALGTGVAYAEESPKAGVVGGVDSGVAPLVNNTDTSFSFSLASAGSTQGTAGRAKDTSSSVYIRIDGWGGKAPRMYIDGYRSGTGWVNCTQGTYHANKTGEYEVYNTVKENGLSMARLTSWGESGYGYVYGVWSPDCVGSFPRL